MTETLRDQQRRVARERILDATAEEIVSVGLMNLSIQGVADRAGVSHRTVYNHFENKDRLVDELADHMGEEMMNRGGRDLPSDLEALPESIRINWKLFGEAGVKAQALARVLAERVSDGGGYSESDDSRNRTEALRNALCALRPDFTAEELQAVTALIRMHVSFHAWYRLTHEFGLDSDTAGRVSSWAFRVMRDALASGDDPFR